MYKGKILSNKYVITIVFYVQDVCGFIHRHVYADVPSSEEPIIILHTGEQMTYLLGKY